MCVCALSKRSRERSHGQPKFVCALDQADRESARLANRSMFALWTKTIARALAWPTARVGLVLGALDVGGGFGHHDDAGADADVRRDHVLTPFERIAVLK